MCKSKTYKDYIGWFLGHINFTKVFVRWVAAKSRFVVTPWVKENLFSSVFFYISIYKISTNHKFAKLLKFVSKPADLNIHASKRHISTGDDYRCLCKFITAFGFVSNLAFYYLTFQFVCEFLFLLKINMHVSWKWLWKSLTVSFHKYILVYYLYLCSVYLHQSNFVYKVRIIGIIHTVYNLWFIFLYLLWTWKKKKITPIEYVPAQFYSFKSCKTRFPIATIKTTANICANLNKCQYM